MSAHAVLASDLMTPPLLVTERGGNPIDIFLKLERRRMKSLCEQLILNDRIVVPTYDFVPLLGLLIVMGEKNVERLLENDRLQFAHHPGTWGFIAEGDDPTPALSGIRIQLPGKRSFVGVDADEALSIILEFFVENPALRRRLLKTALDHTVQLDLMEIIHDIKPACLADIHELQRLAKERRKAMTKAQRRELRKERRQSPLSAFTVDAGTERLTIYPADWNVKNPDGLGVLITVIQANFELAVAEKMACASLTTGAPVGDVLSFRGRRERPDDQNAKLWRILNAGLVKDVSPAISEDERLMAKYLRLTDSETAKQFRGWFHANASLTREELRDAYMDVLHKESWIECLPAKLSRFFVCSLLGAIPLVGVAAGAVDTFVLDKVTKRGSPKCFVQRMREFGRHIQKAGVAKA